MREILFRGKRTDNGEWVYGYYYHHTGEYVKVCYKREPYMISSDCGEGIWLPNEVIPETVGEYTGLTDKNGKKIFEGDILRGEDYPYKNNEDYNYFAEVCWWDNCPAFGLYVHKNPKSKVAGISEGNTENMEDWNSSQWEVIGNIYDNPELLK